jgi:chromosome segregation ATPase
VGKGTSHTQFEGAISGLSNLKRKMDKIDQERELFKVEHSKLEDEVSSVTNSVSKLGDDIPSIRQGMTKLSSTLREELAELKNILLAVHVNKPATSTRRKSHRRAHNSDAASASSNNEKMNGPDAAKYNTIYPETLQKSESWENMCKDSEAEHTREVRHNHKIPSTSQSQHTIYSPPSTHIQ